MSPLQILIDDNVRLLEQGLAVLAGIDATLYAKAEPAVALSGAGSHFRHMLDFYDRFFEGMIDERIDYDRRERDPAIETDPEAASAKVRTTIGRLKELGSASWAPAILVKADAEGARPEETPWAGSTVERELQVLMSHTVHHYALIAVALRLNDFPVTTEFGVAPSTLRYWQEQRACAR